MGRVVITDPVLDEIMTTICDTTGDIRTCLCGRTTFNSDYRGENNTEDTLANLREKARVEPDKFMEVSYSIPSMFMYYGEKSGDVVMGCPCKIAIEVARQWLDSGHQIRELFHHCVLELDRARNSHKAILEKVLPSEGKLKESNANPS